MDNALTDLKQGLSGADLVFVQRMLPHFMTGMSAADAARAVLDDDARLVSVFFRRASSNYFPTPDERGISRRSAEQVGDCIAAELSQRVYAANTGAAA